MPGRGKDLNSAVVDEHVNSFEPPIYVIRFPPEAQSRNLAKRYQKTPLLLCKLNLYYGRLSPKGWESILFGTEGQLDHHPMPHSRDPTQRAVSRLVSWFSSAR